MLYLITNVIFYGGLFINCLATATYIGAMIFRHQVSVIFFFFRTENWGCAEKKAAEFRDARGHVTFVGKGMASNRAVFCKILSFFDY